MRKTLTVLLFFSASVLFAGNAQAVSDVVGHEVNYRAGGAVKADRESWQELRKFLRRIFEEQPGKREKI